MEKTPAEEQTWGPETIPGARTPDVPETVNQTGGDGVAQANEEDIAVSKSSTPPVRPSTAANRRRSPQQARPGHRSARLTPVRAVHAPTIQDDRHAAELGLQGEWLSGLWVQGDWQLLNRLVAPAIRLRRADDAKATAGRDRKVFVRSLAIYRRGWNLALLLAHRGALADADTVSNGPIDGVSVPGPLK